jgi:antirestriction protein ArdC
LGIPRSPDEAVGRPMTLSNRERLGRPHCGQSVHLCDIELCGAFLCAHLGITGELRHAGYIGNWIELLRDDNRAIFTAASKASQAADFLRSFSEPDGREPDNEGS